MPDIQLRPFQPEDAAAFRELNEAWITRYFRIEEQDRIALHDPEGHIIRPGGHIFMAFSGATPVGCCALIPLRAGVFELAKMCVAEEHQGQGLGRKVLAYTIGQAKGLGAKSLFLASNSILANAVHLYESLGFRHLPPERVPPSPYARSNVFMELELGDGFKTG
jgi:putative acetyltransferase